MTEKPMVFWKPKKLAREFHMKTLAVSRLLKSLGARKWSENSYDGPVWYWRDEP